MFDRSLRLCLTMYRRLRRPYCRPAYTQRHRVRAASCGTPDRRRGCTTHVSRTLLRTHRCTTHVAAEHGRRRATANQPRSEHGLPSRLTSKADVQLCFSYAKRAIVGCHMQLRARVGSGPQPHAWPRARLVTTANYDYQFALDTHPMDGPAILPEHSQSHVYVCVKWN